MVLVPRLRRVLSIKGIMMAVVPVKTTGKKTGYTGIGYKRTAGDGAANGGTPGYVDDAAKVYNKDTDHEKYAAAPVSISEIMYHTGRNLPQWIELYNHSLTDGVNLNGWTLDIENDRDADDVPIRTDQGGDTRVFF